MASHATPATLCSGLCPAEEQVGGAVARGRRAGLCTHGSLPGTPLLSPILALSTSYPSEVGCPWVRDSREFGDSTRLPATVSVLGFSVCASQYPWKRSRKA